MSINDPSLKWLSKERLRDRYEMEQILILWSRPKVPAMMGIHSEYWQTFPNHVPVEEQDQAILCCSCLFKCCVLMWLLVKHCFLCISHVHAGSIYVWQTVYVAVCVCYIYVWSYLGACVRLDLRAIAVLPLPGYPIQLPLTWDTWIFRLILCIILVGRRVFLYCRLTWYEAGVEYVFEEWICGLSFLFFLPIYFFCLVALFIHLEAK